MSPAEKPGFNDNKTIYRVGDKDFPVQPATNGTTKYVPVEALEATLKLFPEQDPFSDYDQLKIAGREFTAITDPTDGQTYVHLDAVVAAQEELQSQLNAIQNKPFIEDARKGDLVYVNTGDEFVIGVVRDNMPDKVILDRAYVVHSADYHERKQDMNKKFENLLGEDPESAKKKYDEFKAKIEPPKTPLSLLLHLYLLDQDATSQRAKIVKSMSVAFFRDLATDPKDGKLDPELAKLNYNLFHTDITRETSRDIVDGLRVSAKKTTVNLSHVPLKEGPDGKPLLDSNGKPIFDHRESEVYEAVRTLWYLYSLGKGNDTAFIEHPFDNQNLDTLAASGANGHSAAAGEIASQLIDPDFKEKMTASITPDLDNGGSTDEVVIETAEVLPEWKFKGWGHSSKIAKMYQDLTKSVVSLEQRVQGLRNPKELYKAMPSRRITAEMAQQDLEHARSLQKMALEIVRVPTKEDPHGKTYGFKMGADGKGNGYLTTEHLEDALAIFCGHLRDIKYLPTDTIKSIATKAGITMNAANWQRIKDDDLNLLSKMFSAYVEANAKLIKVDLSRGPTPKFEPLAKKDGTLTEFAEALVHISGEFNEGKDSQKPVVDDIEEAFGYLRDVWAGQNPEKTLAKKIAAAKGDKNAPKVFRLLGLADLAVDSPQEFRISNT